jgi:hypothetical protein
LLLYSSHLPLGVPNGLVINQASVNSKNNSPSVYKASLRRNVGHDVAREAEAVSPLTGRKNQEITALSMCNGQRPVKSPWRVTISMMSSTPVKVNEKYKRTSLETMIVSKEAIYSLGGYSYQKNRSPTRRNEKKQEILCRI